jgi:hypothetical protein
LTNTLSSFLADQPNGKFEDFVSFEALFEVSWGFANSTQIIFGGDKIVCQYNLQSIYTNTNNGFRTLKSGFGYFPILLALYDFLLVTQILNGTLKSCWNGFKQTE